MYCNSARSSERAFTCRPSGAATPESASDPRSATPSSEGTSGFSSLATLAPSRKCDQQARARVCQDRRLAFRVLRNPVRAKRRIDRHGRRPGEQHAREREEKFLRRRQHDGYAVAAPDPALRQVRRHALGSGEKLAKRQRRAFRVAFILEKNQMRFRRIHAPAMAQHILKCLRGRNSLRDPAGENRRGARRNIDAVCGSR